MHNGVSGIRGQVSENVIRNVWILVILSLLSPWSEAIGSRMTSEASAARMIMELAEVKNRDEHEETDEDGRRDIQDNRLHLGGVL